METKNMAQVQVLDQLQPYNTDANRPTSEGMAQSERQLLVLRDGKIY